ncbi:MAG TPA: hypothetical protein VJZ68_00915 [Nitrososphaera sp.]|nr:hypothetical protein [Nitrososphaera sp.]
MGPVKISAVLDAISDDASLELFKLVALTNGTSDVLRSRMNITRKQYYSRLYKLIHCGLIKRKDNQYFLTALGRVMYDSQTTIENALSNYWKIKVVDSLGIAEEISLVDQKKLIETLIQDQGIKNILTK